MPTEEERQQFDLPKAPTEEHKEQLRKMIEAADKVRSEIGQQMRTQPARLDWTQVSSLVSGTSQQMISILMPFLPALARVPKDIYDGFLSHLGNADWDGITTLMYEHMTVAERESLEDAVYVQLKAATLAQYQDIQLLKSVLTNLAVDLLKTVFTTMIL